MTKQPYPEEFKIEAVKQPLHSLSMQTMAPSPRPAMKSKPSSRKHCAPETSWRVGRSAPKSVSSIPAAIS